MTNEASNGVSRRKRKILIATGIFEPEAGGPATFAPRLATLLSRDGWDVTVLTYSAHESYDFDKTYNFKLVRVVRSGRIVNRLKYFLAALRLAGDADVIYTLDWFAAGLPLALAARFLEKKYVARVGGDYAWEQKYCEVEEKPLSLKEFYLQGVYKSGAYGFIYKIVRFVLVGASHVIFNSSEQRDLYCRFFELDKEKTSLILGAVPKEEFNRIVRDKATHEIVFWGRFNGMKNIPTLVHAFAQAKLPPSYTLTLIGDGPQKPKVLALIEKLGLKNRVQVFAGMRLFDVLQTVRNARVFVLPSWTDISPNQIYEALAIKLPFLVTKENFLAIRGQIPAMIDPHSVDDVAQKLEMMADDEKYNDFVHKLSAIGVQRSWEDVAKEHIEVFRNAFDIDRVRVLSVGADRSKRGILYPDSAASARQKAYGSHFDSLDIVGFSLRKDRRSDFDITATTHVHPTSSLTRALYGLDALEIAHGLSPTVVSTQDPFETGLIGYLVAKGKGLPLHVQVHTDFLAPEYASLGFGNRIRVRIAKFILRRATGIRVVSERIRTSIERHIAPSAPITVLPIFADLEKFRHAPLDRDLLRRFAVFKKKILVVSRFEREKNVALAIRSFAAAAPNDACLIIVGGGTERARLSAIVHDLKLGERVFFEHPREVAPYFKIADLVLVTSHYEGYGLVVIEGLAAGKPVLSTDVGIAHDAGAIVTTKGRFTDALRDWFKNGPREGHLRNYPYRSFDEYARAYSEDIRACADAQ